MNNKSISTIEEELLSSISGDFKVGDVLAMIVGAAEEAGDSVADGWLELVQEALTDKADIKGMMKLLLVPRRCLLSRARCDIYRRYDFRRFNRKD